MTGKILMIIAMVITMAHNIIPHQHQHRVQLALNNSFFPDCDLRIEESDLLKKLDHIIKHVNLGEKHLEEFITSSYNSGFSPISWFEVPNTLSVLEFKNAEAEIVKHQYYYKHTLSSQENSLSSGLRAPPCI